MALILYATLGQDARLRLALNWLPVIIIETKERNGQSRANRASYVLSGYYLHDSTD